MNLKYLPRSETLFQKMKICFQQEFVTNVFFQCTVTQGWTYLLTDYTKKNYETVVRHEM